MRRYTLPSLLVFASLGRAQYTTTTGTPGSYSGTFVVESLYGPLYGDRSFTLHSFSWCKREGAASDGACPWTLPFQTLYDNAWDDVYTRTIYLAPGSSINVVSNRGGEWNTQTHVRNADGVVFKRSYRWEIWTADKVWFQ